MKCHYCDEDACIQVTALRAGQFETYGVCRTHAQEKTPLEDGVMLPPVCPKCGGEMHTGTAWEPIEGQRNQAKWIKAYLHCSNCEYQMEAPKPGKK